MITERSVLGAELDDRFQILGKGHARDRFWLPSLSRSELPVIATELAAQRLNDETAGILFSVVAGKYALQNTVLDVVRLGNGKLYIAGPGLEIRELGGRREGYRVGRGSEQDGPDASSTIDILLGSSPAGTSRKHAYLGFADESSGFGIIDLGSTNGTRLYLPGLGLSNPSK